MLTSSQLWEVFLVLHGFLRLNLAACVGCVMIQKSKKHISFPLKVLVAKFPIFRFKKRFRSGSIVSRFFREIFEKNVIRPLVGIQLMAGALMFAPLDLSVHPTEPAYPGVLMSDVVLEVSVEPVIVTESNQMQNPTAGFKGVSNTFRPGHAGYDLRAYLGSDVYPVADGVVKQIADSTYGYGRRVIIEHDNGFESLYAHMGLISVEEGEVITQETKLGEVGMTGYTTGPHIHLELYENGIPVNPAYYLDLDDIPTQQ
jgi:hypothetical protein